MTTAKDINKAIPSDKLINAGRYTFIRSDKCQTIISNMLLQKYMDFWMGLEDKSAPDINLAPPASAPKSKRVYEYKKDDDDQMEGFQDNACNSTLTSHENAQTNYKTTVAFLGISYDPKMHVGKEENYIRACLNFDVTRCGFTKQKFEDALIKSPNIIHISTHGFYQNQFFIALEESQWLRYLLDDHPKYSTYYAAVAVFFEMEVDHFVRFKEQNSKIEIECELLNDDKIYKMLECIADRYGCVCTKKHDTCVEISCGKSDTITPVEFSTFSAMYDKDQVVTEIVKKITNAYNCSVTSVTKRSKTPQHQNFRGKFFWNILSAVLRKMIPIDCAETSATTNDIGGNNVANIQATQIKIGRNQALTKELLIMPNMDEAEFRKLDVEKQQKIIENLEQSKNKIVHLLKQEILVDFDLSNYNKKNIHVIRFKDEIALERATQNIDDIRTNCEYKEYRINFSSLQEAQNITKQIVGFIPETQQSIYAIDTKNQTDAISSMIKKCLQSRAECKIKLVVLNACNSYMLGKIFSEYVENVICVHPFVKIWDSTANTFTKYFYDSLQTCMDANQSMSFSDCVYKAYGEAKQHISKECVEDCSCKSHSHLPTCKPGENEINGLNDGKTVLISNVSITEMKELHQHLENSKPDANEDEKEEFVKKALYHKNVWFDELSTGYFQFETQKHRNAAQKLLSEKHSDFKQTKHVGWRNRIAANCCCSPNHPHMVEDKFILLQNGHIINEEINITK